jgi:hypothetical protein
MTKVFFIEPTDRQRLYLRRHTHFQDKRGCSARPGDYSYCDAMFYIGDAPVVFNDKGYIEDCDELRPPNADPRWPTKCEHCGQLFQDGDEYQLFHWQIYRRADTGEEMVLRDAPAGAVWNAWWIADRKERYGLAPGVGSMIGPDGRSLVVRMPDGSDWMIDSRASNCTMKDDKEHFCWVRHGRPEDGTLHVDKNGKTCAAGAGSIATGKWHGFLHNGELYDC